MKKDEYGLVIIEGTDNIYELNHQFNENNEAIKFQLQRLSNEIKNLAETIKRIERQIHD